MAEALGDSSELFRPMILLGEEVSDPEPHPTAKEETEFQVGLEAIQALEDLGRIEGRTIRL